MNGRTEATPNSVPGKHRKRRSLASCIADSSSPSAASAPLPIILPSVVVDVVFSHAEEERAVHMRADADGRMSEQRTMPCLENVTSHLPIPFHSNRSLLSRQTRQSRHYSCHFWVGRYSVCVSFATGRERIRRKTRCAPISSKDRGRDRGSPNSKACDIMTQLQDLLPSNNSLYFRVVKLQSTDSSVDSKKFD